jgi:hypothetical protein
VRAALSREIGVHKESAEVCALLCAFDNEDNDMQIMVNTDLSGLLSSLQLAKRGTDYERAAQVQLSCTDASELVMLYAETFRNLCMPTEGTEPDRMRHKQRLQDYHKNDCCIRVAKEGNRTVGGYMVLQGQLLAFHHHLRGRGLWMLDDALHHGANKLTCFDLPPLVKLYTERGFEVTGRLDNWNQGGPDVLSMGLK